MPLVKNQAAAKILAKTNTGGGKFNGTITTFAIFSFCKLNHFNLKSMTLVKCMRYTD